MLLPSLTAGTSASPLLRHCPRGSSPQLLPQCPPQTHFTARTGRARQLLGCGQAVRAKRQPGKTRVDALQDELCVADMLLSLLQTS